MRQFPLEFLDQDTVKFGDYTVKRCGCILNKKGSELKPRPTPRKRSLKVDMQVGLYDKGKRHWLQVNRIVTHCFHSLTGEEFNTMESNHKDFNTLNNHADNLEWVQPEENKAHYWENGYAK